MPYSRWKVNYCSRLGLRAALLICLVLAAVGIAQAQDTSQNTQANQNNDPVVIQIGDETITQSEFDQRFALAARNVAARQGIPYTEETRALFDSLRPAFLEQLTTELVLLQEAQNRGINITDEEVENQLSQLRGRFESETDFLEFLAEAGFEDEAAFRQFVKNNLAVQAVAEILGEDVTVGDEQIQNFYQANQQQFEQPEQVCVRHILVGSAEEANQVMQELEGGADFGEVAQARSTDPGSAAQGGDIGCITRGQTVAPFEEAAFSAQTGETVGPVETQFGQHILQVYDRREAGVTPLEQVREGIRQQLQREGLNQRINELRQGSGVQVFPENITAPGASSEGGPILGAGIGTVEVSPEEFATLQTAYYEIYPTEGFNVNGTVQVTENPDGGARVTVTLQNTEDGQLYPSHFHAGDCGTGGAIVYPLEPIPGGPQSIVTHVEASVFDIINQDLHINIHRSPDDLQTIVACGEVGLGANEQWR